MKIEAHGLYLEMVALGRADPEEGWARVQVLVSVPGFKGQFEASLQVEDLSRFAAECAHMHASVGVASEATLGSAEPDILIVLKSNPRGHVAGRYHFESQRTDGVPTALSGLFESDQAGLPALEKGARELAHELART
jgi:hypothetical protein